MLLDHRQLSDASLKYFIGLFLRREFECAFEFQFVCLVLSCTILFNVGVEEKLIKFKDEKVNEMKCCQISDTLAPKCSSTSNVSSTREVGSSANTCEFMSSAYSKNCSININVNRLSKCE